MRLWLHSAINRRSSSDSNYDIIWAFFMENFQECMNKNSHIIDSRFKRLLIGPNLIFLIGLLSNLKLLDRLWCVGNFDWIYIEDRAGLHIVMEIFFPTPNVSILGNMIRANAQFNQHVFFIQNDTMNCTDITNDQNVSLLHKNNSLPLSLLTQH